MQNTQQPEEEFILYKILNVGKTASQDKIKTQYRKLAIQFHPDRNDNSEEAKKNFQRLQEAYEILRDEKKRKIYDRTGMLTREYS